MILEANTELGCNFIEQNLIPIFDCFNNDYICYNYVEDLWCMFNIVDEISFDFNSDILKLGILNQRNG